MNKKDVESIAYTIKDYPLDEREKFYGLDSRIEPEVESWHEYEEEGVGKRQLSS